MTQTTGSNKDISDEERLLISRLADEFQCQGEECLAKAQRLRALIDPGVRDNAVPDPAPQIADRSDR